MAFYPNRTYQLKQPLFVEIEFLNPKVVYAYAFLYFEAH